MKNQAYERITPVNWGTYQTVTVFGVNDPDTTNEIVAVTFSSPGLSDKSLAVTVLDDDVIGIEMSVPTLSVNEGTSGTFAVRLTAAPAANTTVSVTSGNTSKVTASPPSLLFTPINWNIAQTVTVSGVDDVDTVNENVTVTASSSGIPSSTTSVTVLDDDVLGISTSVSSLTVGESGSGTFGVRLTAQPPANTTVTVMSGNTSKATISPVSLTFTPMNWSINQTVLVFGVNDADAANESVTVTVSATGFTSVSVTANVTDDD